MSSDDYIKMPDGRKLYLNGIDAKVNTNKLKDIVPDFLFEIDENRDGFYNPSEIQSIFTKVQDYAKKDGNNELSEVELDNFIKENVSEEKLGKKKQIKLREKVVNFLMRLQDEQIAESKLSNIKPDNTIHKLFPELDFLELGDDRNVGVEKLRYDNLKAKFSNSEKYELIEENNELTVKDKNTGNVVLEYKKVFDMDEIFIYSDDKKIEIELCGSVLKGFEKDIDITTEEMGYIKVRNDMLSYGSLIDGIYEYKNGIVNQVENEKTGTITRYNNGELYRIVTYNDELVKNYKVEKLEKLLHNIQEPNEVSNLIESIIKDKRDVELIEDYYQLTGREIFDDIQNSNLPDSVKTDLINKLSGQFADSKYYNAHLVIENSKVENKHYTGDEYKVTYNGPIINVQNKTTGETTRLNLVFLLENFDLKDWGIKNNLRTIQSYSGEILENIGIEVQKFRYMSRRQLYKQNMSAFYTYKSATITTAALNYTDYDGGAGIVLHEFGHGIDAYLDDNGEIKFISESEAFTDVYNDCIERYKKQYKIYSYNNSSKSSSIKKLKKAQYFSANSREAFAICISGILGKPDEDFRFIEKHYPELIVAANEAYLEVKKMPKEKRQQQNS